MAGFSKLGNMAKAKQCVEILLEVYSRGRTRDVLKTSCPARGTGVRIAPLPPKDAQLQSYLDNIID